MSNEIRIETVKTDIRRREELLLLQQKNNSDSGFTNRRKLKELRNTLVQLECQHVLTRASYEGRGVSTRDIINNDFCPKCGRSLLAGGIINE